jgi:hypothetical protein
MFNLKATSIIQEYFLSDGIGKVIWSFQVLAAPDYHTAFVKRFITLAMDQLVSSFVRPKNYVSKSFSSPSLLTHYTKP